MTNTRNSYNLWNSYNLCTLFDKNYLARGLSLYQSLIEYCPDFTLWILCMDDESYDMLRKMQLEKVRLIRLADVEDGRMLAVKSTRTAVEYCWMFSSALPLYLLDKYPDMGSIAYIDADIYFFAPIDAIFEEFGENSIMIIPHRFSEKNRYREKTSGIYNVGMMIFRNDTDGRNCLNWWKDRVIEWCFNRYEDGKLGDQLYLNDWPTRFKKVCILGNLGANVAPWNIDRFTFRQTNTSFIGSEIISSRSFPLIFYHFHGLHIYLDMNENIQAYPITVYNKHIYKTYIMALNKSYKKIRNFEEKWTYGCSRRLNIFRRIYQRISKHKLN